MTDSDVYHGLEPRELWRHFAALNAIPRPSGGEAAASAYVRRVAESAGATWTSDARGNTVVRVPARSGGEDAPAVAIQSHLDMVCEKRPDVMHDFETDPIRPRREGDLVFASGTTLGADNGIGAAAALAFLTTPDLRHGPLELLFTVEEETGLYGAMELDPLLLKARMLINLDSEDPDELTVGCAGGAGAILRLPIVSEPTPRDWYGCKVVVSGLKGGHSGVQIHERLANAIKLLVEVLIGLRETGADFRLVALSGGTAHNAIPRDATAHIAIAPKTLPALEAGERIYDALHSQWSVDEPDFTLHIENADTPSAVMSAQCTNTALSLLRDLPHGVVKMSEAFPGKVETSSNLANVQTLDGHLEIATSSRSFVAAELDKVQRHIETIGAAAGAEIEIRDGYPGWEPDADSRLLRVAEEVYGQVCGKQPAVQVVHAGLECGVIVSKIPGMEAISFGPLIRGAHTPEEYVDASTVEPTWKLLVALLNALSH